MLRKLRIVVLADNCVGTVDMLAEHGLSLWIEADGARVLFDTGQGKVLRRNAGALGVRLSEAGAVVLSHGHYDHTGGLETLLEDCSPQAIFLHPAALEPKYARKDHPPHRYIGIPQGARGVLEESKKLVWTKAAAEVAPGVWCTGEIPRLHAHGSGETSFFTDPQCREQDRLADDQALFIETRDGLVVLAGCAHAGIANTLDHIAALTGRREIHALIGGLHLAKAGPDELEAAGNAIERRNPRLIAPCHCTGFAAQSYLFRRFPAAARPAGTGAVFEFGES